MPGGHLPGRNDSRSTREMDRIRSQAISNDLGGAALSHPARLQRLRAASIGALVAKLAGFAPLVVITPIAHRSFKADEFGAWLMANNLILTLSAFDFGAGSAVVTMMAPDVAAGAHARVWRWCKAALGFVAPLSMAMLCVGMVLCDSHLPNPMTLAFGPNAIEHRRLLGIATISSAAMLPLSILSRVQLAHQRASFASYWQVGATILGVLCFALASRFTANARTLLVCYVAPGLAVGAGQAALVIRTIYRRAQVAGGGGLVDVGVSFRRVALTWAIAQAAGVLATGLDQFLVSSQVGTAGVRGYAIAARLQSAMMLGQLVAVPFWPAIAAALRSGDARWANAAFRKLVTALTGLGVLQAWALLVLGPPIVRRWLGSDVIPGMSTLAPFAAWTILSHVFFAFSAVLSNQDYLRAFTTATAAAAVFAIVLKLGALHFAGPPAVMWSTVIAYACALPHCVHLTNVALSAGAPSAARKK